MNSHDSYIGNELGLFAHAQNWKRYYRGRLAPFIGGDVLEVGAGIGETTAVLGRLPHRHWTCLEPDSELVARHKRELSQSAHTQTIEHIVGTIADLPKERVFDSVIYIDVLEHIESDKEELDLAAQHLRSGGHLIVLSPAHQWLFSEFDAAIGHFRRYCRRSLEALKPDGLVSRRFEYLDSMGLITSSANRLLLRKSMPTLRQIQIWDGFFIPVSKIMDPLLRHRLGKTIVGVWSRVPDTTPGS